MKLIRSPLCGRVLIVGLLALVPAATLATSASAASTTLNFDYSCQGATPKGLIPGNISGQTEVLAPDSVEHSADFKIVIKGLPLTVPQFIQGRKVIEVTEGRWRLELPTNATFHGASITDGSGIGGAELAEIDNGLLVTVRGPLAGGETFQFPEITLKVEADFPDTEIVTRQAGTSFDDFGLELDTRIQGQSGRIFDVGVRCFPDQGAVLSTTTVGSENNNNNNNNNGQHGNDQNKPQKPHKPKPQNPHKPHQPHKPKPHRPHVPCVLGDGD